MPAGGRGPAGSDSFADVKLGGRFDDRPGGGGTKKAEARADWVDWTGLIGHGVI
jgi:hypothetical protein